MTSWRRLLALAAIGAVGTLAALSISTSLALFSSTGSQQVNHFAAGTVSLESCSAGSTKICTPSTAATCTFSKDSACDYDFAYTGSLTAWIGVYVVVAAPASCAYLVTYEPAVGQRVDLSPTEGPTVPGAIPDLIADAGPAPPQSDFDFTVTGGNSVSGCSVTITGQAVQLNHNSGAEPKTHLSPHVSYVSPSNPLGSSTGPLYWS